MGPFIYIFLLSIQWFELVRAPVPAAAGDVAGGAAKPLSGYDSILPKPEPESGGTSGSGGRTNGDSTDGTSGSSGGRAPGVGAVGGNAATGSKEEEPDIGEVLEKVKDLLDAISSLAEFGASSASATGSATGSAPGSATGSASRTASRIASGTASGTITGTLTGSSTVTATQPRQTTAYSSNPPGAVFCHFASSVYASCSTAQSAFASLPAIQQASCLCTYTIEYASVAASARPFDAWISHCADFASSNPQYGTTNAAGIASGSVICAAAAAATATQSVATTASTATATAATQVPPTTGGAISSTSCGIGGSFTVVAAITAILAAHWSAALFG